MLVMLGSTSRAEREVHHFELWMPLFERRNPSKAVTLLFPAGHRDSLLCLENLILLKSHSCGNGQVSRQKST